MKKRVKVRKRKETVREWGNEGSDKVWPNPVGERGLLGLKARGSPPGGPCTAMDTYSSDCPATPSPDVKGLLKSQSENGARGPGQAPEDSEAEAQTTSTLHLLLDRHNTSPHRNLRPISTAPCRCPKLRGRLVLHLTVTTARVLGSRASDTATSSAELTGRS